MRLNYLRGKTDLKRTIKCIEEYEKGLEQIKKKNTVFRHSKTFQFWHMSLSFMFFKKY